jgi:hypothetical protein
MDRRIVRFRAQRRLRLGATQLPHPATRNEKRRWGHQPVVVVRPDGGDRAAAAGASIILP